MEQNNISKMTHAMWILIDKTKELNSKFDTLAKEILTEDVKKMIEEITKAEHTRFLEYGFHDHLSLHLGYRSNASTLICLSLCDKYEIDYHLDRVYSLEEYNSTNEEYLIYLESVAGNYKKIKECYDLIYNNIEDIINCITEVYKNCIIKQSELLDNILSDLGESNEPTKHIKITVEYI